MVQDVLDMVADVVDVRVRSKGGSHGARREEKEVRELNLHLVAIKKTPRVSPTRSENWTESRAASEDDDRRRTTDGEEMSKAAFAGLKAVQELRFHLCQTSKGSEGVRNFLLNSYKNLKAASPMTPVLIRESAGVEGKLYARYDFGVEKHVSLEGLDAKAVEKCLTELVASAPK